VFYSIRFYFTAVVESALPMPCKHATCGWDNCLKICIILVMYCTLY